MTICAFLLAGPTTPTAAKKKPDSKEDTHKPRLSLRADPSVGFTPVTVILTGHLTGVDMQDPNFCHPAVTWTRIDPGQTENDNFRVREDPGCVHPPEEVTVVDTYTKIFDLYDPGTYLFRIQVDAKDGKRVVSSYIQVQVLRVH